MVLVYGRRDCDDVKSGLPQLRLVRGEFDRRGCNRLISDLLGRVISSLIERNLVLVDIEPDDLHLSGKGHGNRQTDIAETDQRELRPLVQKFSQ